MSHFSVCVIVPDDGVVNNIHANNLEDHLIPVLAPFDEQTEEEKYREFEDRTEEAKADFENDIGGKQLVDGVRGRIEA